MDRGARRPAEPEGGENEEGAGEAGEGEAAHFFAAGPGFVGGLRAPQDEVPEEVEGGGEDGADADGEEGEAFLAGVEVVDVGEDEGEGLEVDVEDCVWGRRIRTAGGGK